VSRCAPTVTGSAVPDPCGSCASAGRLSRPR
jgi:hypothetical protein